MNKEARKPGRSQTENLPCPMKFVFFGGRGWQGRRGKGRSVFIVERSKANLSKRYLF